MSQRPSYRWMRSCLALLYDRVDDERARAMVLDPDQRAAVYDELALELKGLSMPEGMLRTREGESLGIALLALRLRFPREVGLEKVEVNIAMREGRA
ncbi:MAG TPA: hypothetical protein PKA95_18100 [Thermomicrobiales bacterium]|nr:hypothetical protein [Thermomicrobiales bacterium]